MKRNLGLFTTGICLLLLSVSCNKSREKQLSKSWQVYHVELESVDTNSTGEDALLDGGENLQMQMMSEMLGKPSYKLHDDGSCEMSNKGTSNKGSWKLEAGGRELLILGDGMSEKESKKVKPMLIEKLDDTSMVLLLNSEQSSYRVRYRLKATED